MKQSPWDLALAPTALVAYRADGLPGDTTPLPVSLEFTEEVRAVRPALERAATSSRERNGDAVRLRAERDTPYGQLTRMMQAGLAFRIAAYVITTGYAEGALQSIDVAPPGPAPRGKCYATAWVGPDGRVQVGIDANGIVVHGQDGRVDGDAVVGVLRRLDERCATGVTRLSSQPTAAWGSVFDLARQIASASPRPHIASLQLAVPTIGPMDSPVERAR